MIKSLIHNGTTKLSNTNFCDNKLSKTGIFYVYDKEKFSKLNWIKNTKTEFRNWFKCVKESLSNNDFDSFGVDYIIKKENEYLYGNIQYIYENMKDFIGDSYTYLYENKSYTKSFESDLVLRFIEIYSILTGIIQLIEPLITIENTYEIMKDISDNINTDKTFDIMGNKLMTKKDKINFKMNGKKILSLLNYHNNKFMCNLDYYTLFKLSKVI